MAVVPQSLRLSTSLPSGVNICDVRTSVVTGGDIEKKNMFFNSVNLCFRVDERPNRAKKFFSLLCEDKASCFKFSVK